jgi:xanthine dehydrogenase accessory factor
MDTIYRDIVDLLERGEPFALATVVHTSGSTPQRAGAKAVFLPDGRILGTLGGGCMEAESRQRGLSLIGGGEPLFFDLHLDDDFGWDDGLICGGTAQIFIQPMTNATPEVYQAALAVHEARGRGALVSVVSGGPPESLGRPVLIREDGSATGTVPASPLAAALVEETRKALEASDEAPRRLRLANGTVAYLEPILPRPTLLVCGAGHVGSALVHYASRVGFDVVAIDDRPSWAARERLPDAKEILVEDIVAAVRRYPKTPETYVVIVTRGHRHDAVVLREVIHEPVAYIGMIGSRRKILTIYEEFLAEGIATAEELARVHAPIGLDIGGISVEEIALSIGAELVAVRRKGKRHGDHGDRAGGGGIAANGDAEAALAVRAAQRDRDGRELSATLPHRRGAGGPRPPGGGDCPVP